MNALNALMKCASVGLVVGFLMSAGLSLGNEIVPLAGLMVALSGILALFELTSLEPQIAAAKPV